MTTVSTCEVCDAKELLPVLNLGKQPLCDDLIPVGDDTRPAEYPIEILFCASCLTAHQKYQVPRSILFPSTYHYRAAMTQDVLAGMGELVALAERFQGGLAGSLVLDIGCNDGSLLAQFRAAGAHTVGIEPTGAAADAAGRVDSVINEFFDARSVEQYLSRFRKPDVITFTNVFAHIEDLTAVLDCLKTLIADGTKLIIENHYLGSVLARHQFDTFYHEHPRTYSFRSFVHIAEKLDMSICHVDFPARYNGNIRVVMARQKGAECPRVSEEGFPESFAHMKGYISEAKDRMMDRLAGLVRVEGRLAAKAFPGRAAVILNYYGLGEDLIYCTYERPGSPKIGHYIPGTRIPIGDERELFAKTNVPTVVNLAWHIKDEIHRYMRQNGYNGQILEIFG